MPHTRLLLSKPGYGGGRSGRDVRSQGTVGLLCLQRSSHGAVLFFELPSALTLLTLDPFPLGQGQHLFVFDAELPAVELEVVHGLDDLGCLLGSGEVCESKTPEDAIVEVVVEGIGQGKAKLSHEGDELFLLDGEGNVLDDDGGGDELLIHVLGELVLLHLRVEQRVGVAVAQATQGEGGKTLGLIEPSLAIVSTWLQSTERKELAQGGSRQEAGRVGRRGLAA